MDKKDERYWITYFRVGVQGRHIEFAQGSYTSAKFLAKEFAKGADILDVRILKEVEHVPRPEED